MEGKVPVVKRKAVLPAVLAVMIALLYFYNGSAVISGVKDGLAACVNAVIPSLFPFMVLCSFLVHSRLSDTLSRPLSGFTVRVLHLPEHTGSVFLLSLIGGYPIGARAIAELCREKRLDTDTAARMLCFCVNAGPAFLITAVGTRMMGNHKAGILVFAAQTLASVVIGCFLGLRHKNKYDKQIAVQDTVVTAPLAQSFVAAVTGAAQGIFSICAFVTAFSAILALVNSLPTTAALCAMLPTAWCAGAQAALTGLFEVTLGCVSAARVPGIAAILFTAVLCSFGGLSVICQTISYFSGLKVSMRPYLVSRAAHMLLSLLFAFVLTRLFPDTIAAFSFTQNPAAVHTFSGTPFTACALLLLCAALIVCRKDKMFL